MPRVGWVALGGILAALIAAGGEARPAVAASVVVAGVLVGAATLRRRRAMGLAAGALLVLVRVVLGTLGGGEAPRPPLGAAADWTASVVSIGAPAEGEQRAVLELLSPSQGRAWARLPRYPAVIPGDRIRFRAALEPLPVDGGFAAYLARIGVAATVEVRALEVSSGTETGSAVERSRRAAGDAAAAVLPEPEAGLAAGIVIGLRDRVDRSVADDLTTAGLSHVVAISGWNIALVGALVGAALRRWSRRRRTLATIAVIAGYTVLAGGGASVLRAALMAAVVLATRETGRPGRAAAALGVAVWALLLVDPETVTDPGFALSVTATAGLLAWGGPLTEALRQRLPARVPAWLCESLGVSLAAQAATLPIVLFAFGRVSFVAPLANLLVAPLVAPAMAVGAAAVAVGGLVAAGAPAALGVPVAVAGRITLGGIVAVGHATAALPFASLTLDEQTAPLAGLLAAGALLVAGTSRGRAALGTLRSRDRGRRAAARRPAASREQSGHLTASVVPRAALIGLAALVAAVALGAAARPDGRLRLTVLDIGQGDAILLEGDRGSRLLVDSGPDPDRLLALLDARLPPWDRRIDLVVLTHPHEDHAAGLALLLARYRVDAVAEPGMRGPGPGYAAYRAALASLGWVSRRLAAGDHLALDGATIDVRWPPRDSVPAEPPDSGTGINNVSLVLDVRFGARRLLLTGDVEEEIDPRLIADGVADGRRLDVLKVAHHGSRTSSTEAFLDALRPRVAIVSAGAGNPYGHPTAQALDRLRAAGARTYRTDRDGSVTVETDGHDLRVHASGGRESGAAGAPQPLALFRCGAPRIAGWPSPTGVSPPRSSPTSGPPPGISVTSRAWPRSPPSWPIASQRAVSGSIVAWSRRRRSSTTWTGSSPPTTRSASSRTGTRALAG